jgi:tetratricopeptide (TPR) repeat protein
VFISSTFRDMQAERDELVKRVFPRLRKLCEHRGVTWGEVDLRWGITDEQAAEGQVLPICLEEIRRCRPYFIGLLGERYGWVPEDVAPELVAREPWLEQQRGRSVTELEIVHGVLSDPTMAESSFFYLRDPDYVASLPEAQQAALREGPAPEEIAEHGAEEAGRRAEVRRARLAALKERIRDSGLPVRDYPEPRAVGELILADLTAVIDRHYPDGSQPTPLEREAAEHEAFARSRAGIYIGRSAYSDALDAHAAGDGEPLVLLGESGAGKSALLANWALGYREAHPDELVALHFIGSTPQSTDWAAMLRRVMDLLARRFGIEGEIPDRPEELRLAFANWLHMAAARGRIVLVLDALDQLEDRQGAADLVWLPPVVPSRVRLVLSTLPGRPLEVLARRGWPALEVEPLQTAERDELIRSYLAEYGKDLSHPLAVQIATADQTANPLFLRVLLEELRLWGEHETLGERIHHYLDAPTIPDLYRLVLSRWQTDYERDRPGLIADALSLLWASRRGLSEAEMLDLLGSGGEPLPAAHWSSFFLAAEQSLGKRVGLIGFAHDYLRQAVRDAHLASAAAQRAAHLRLAEYFDERRDEPRAVDELPWQLAEAGAWERLRERLVEPAFLTRAWAGSKVDVKSCWQRVEAHSGLRLADSYRPVVTHPPDDLPFLWALGSLLFDTGHLDLARALRMRLVERFRATGERANLAAALGSQAWILQIQGDLDGAMVLHEEAETICRELDDEEGLAGCLDRQGHIRKLRGDLDGAMALHQEAERLRRELGRTHGLQVTLGSQAMIQLWRSDLASARTLLEECERLCREQGDLQGLSECMTNQARVRARQGDLDGALALHEESEAISRELGNKEGAAWALGGRAVILQHLHHLDEALSLLEESEQLWRELGNTGGLISCLGNQAVILQVRGDLDGALRLHKEAELLCREQGHRGGLASSLAGQAWILQVRGDDERALALHEEEERLHRDLGDPRGLAICLGNQAVLLAEGLHRSDQALRRVEEAGDLVSQHNLTDIAEGIRRIRDRVRAAGR